MQRKNSYCGLILGIIQYCRQTKWFTLPHQSYCSFGGFLKVTHQLQLENGSLHSNAATKAAHWMCTELSVLILVPSAVIRVPSLTLTAVGHSQLLARWPGTLSLTLPGIQRAAQTCFRNIAVCSVTLPHLYGHSHAITQCYLPPGRGHIPSFTSAKLLLD